MRKTTLARLQFNDFVFQGVPGSRLRDLFDVSQLTLAAWSPVLRPLSCSGQYLYFPVQMFVLFPSLSVLFNSTLDASKTLNLVVSSLGGNVVSPVPKTLISFDLFDYYRLISNIYLRLQLPHPVVNSMHADF